MKTNNKKVLTAQMARAKAQEVKSSVENEVKMYIKDFVEHRISLEAGKGRMSTSIALGEIEDTWRDSGLSFISVDPNVLFTLAELDSFLKEVCVKQTEYGFVYEEEDLSSKHRTSIHKLSWE